MNYDVQAAYAKWRDSVTGGSRIAHDLRIHMRDEDVEHLLFTVFNRGHEPTREELLDWTRRIECRVRLADAREEAKVWSAHRAHRHSRGG